MLLQTRASTKETFNGTLPQSIQTENELHRSFIASKLHQNSYTYPKLQYPKTPIRQTTTHNQNIVTHSRWLKDGSSFVTASEDMGIRIYITSQTLLEDVDELLIPFIRMYQSFPISAFDTHPSSSLYDSYCTSLVSSSDSPIKLVSLIPDEDGANLLLKSYKTQNDQTEKFPKITTLRFMSESTFIAGSDNCVMLYDITNSEATGSIVTKIGTTSQILPAKSDFLKSGSFYCSSFNNKVQIYSDDFQLITSTNVDGGNGITQIIESDNGKFLYSVKRNSTAIDILDIRMNLRKVGELNGFESKNQRILGDVLPKSQGLVIGSSNGYINWYKDSELGLSTSPETLQFSKSSISSISINPIDPSIILTTIGDRSYDKPLVQINQLT